MPRASTWRAALAWLVIVAMCGVMVMGHAPPDQGDGGDPVGDILVEIQGKVLIGIGRLFPFEGPRVYEQAEGTLNLGSLGQRQRFLVIAAALAGPAEARRQLDRLDYLIDAAPDGPVELTESQQAVQRVLHDLLPASLPDLDAERADAVATEAAAALSPGARDTLREQLGWFGELAASVPGTTEHEQVLRSASTVAIVVLAAALIGGGGLMVGFAGLVVVVVLLILGRLGRPLPAGGGPHHLYAETFAIWMVLFNTILAVVGRMAPPESVMLLTGAGFLLSLVALGWPVLWGVPPDTVRRDLGWTLGGRPVVEPLIGAGGYLMTLPLLLGGLLVTLMLLAVETTLAGDSPTFAPAGAPSHPVLTYMSGDRAWPKIQVLLLASVAAPIVEETMFRGVLYRHLRDASRSLATIGSISTAVAVNCFVFAVIHPQGLAFVPALGSLAAGMSLVREWRGTLVPSMMIHAISNGVIMTMLWTVLAL